MQILKMNVIVSGIRTLMAMICQFIYPLISNIYNLFINISKVNILSDKFGGIYQRVTLILTIVMVFYVTFQFVKYVVQPDAMTDKEKGAGKIIYKLIAVIVLIAFVPDIFGFAHKIQDAIIDKNVIGQVILGPTNTTNPSELGSTFSASLFNISYSIDEDKREEKCGDIVCGSLVDMNIKMLANNNDLSYLTMGLDSVTKETSPINSEKVEVPTINFLFHGFLAVAIGLFVGYILVLYCIDVGVRWAQLVYLQIIAPIPIIGFLSPKKDNIFNKWLGQCVTTYLDLFIRQIIIYLILLLSSIILEIYYDPTKGDLLAKVDPSLRKWVFIFLIMGLMLFAHKAPKMLAELLPKKTAASGNFGVGWKDASARVAPEVARAAGVALGSSRILTGAVARGIKAHRRKIANQPDRTKEREHRNKLAQTRTERSNLARYEKSANFRNQKKDELNKAGEEYMAARKARIDAEKQGKTGAELDRLKQQEQLAKQKATTKGQEYRKAADQMQIDRETYLGKAAIEKEKEERKAAAIAQQKARQESQNLQQNMPGKEQARRTAEQNTATAQTAYDATSASLDASKQEKENAQTRKNDAASKIQSAEQELAVYEQQKAAAEAKLNTAKQNGLTDPNQIALMEGEIAGIEHHRAQAAQKLTNAQNEFTNADVALKNAEADITTKEQELKTAKNNLDNAKTDEKDAIEAEQALQKNIAEQNNIEKQNQEFIKSKEEKLQNETSKETIETKNAELNEQERALESQIAEDINKRRGTNVATEMLGGAIVGGYYGVTEGIKATKLEDIGKKVSEGYKKDIKAMKEVEKYYDNGGIKTWVGRTIDKVENAVIGETIPLPHQIRQPDYKTTQMTRITPLERNIKQAEASISVETDVKSKVDSAKSRTEDKLETEEVKIKKDGFNIPDNLKGNVDISGASTVSDVYRMYKANATTKQSIADAAAKDYEAKKAAGITGQELIDAEARAKNASQEAQNARFIKDQIKKKATEFAFTQILKATPEERRSNTDFDQVMVGKISDLEQSIANARKNNDTVSRMREVLINDEILFNAFMTGKFESFEQLDKVQTHLINIANERSRDVSRMKEEKRQLETSSVTQAQKADSDFSGSGK